MVQSKIQGTDNCLEEGYITKNLSRVERYSNNILTHIISIIEPSTHHMHFI